MQVCLFSFHTQPTLTEQVCKKLCCTFYCQPLLLAVYSLHHHHIDHASTVSTKAHHMEGFHHHQKDHHCRKTSEHHSNHCKYGSNYHHHDKGSDHHHKDQHIWTITRIPWLCCTPCCIISTSSGIFSFVLYFSV